MVALPPLIADSGKTQKPKLKHQFQAEYDKFADKEFYKDFRFTFFPLPLPTEELPRKSVRCLVAWITECLVWSLNTRSTLNFEHGIKTKHFVNIRTYYPTHYSGYSSIRERGISRVVSMLVLHCSQGIEPLDTMQCNIAWSQPGSVTALTPLLPFSSSSQPRLSENPHTQRGPRASGEGRPRWPRPCTYYNIEILNCVQSFYWKMQKESQ